MPADILRKSSSSANLDTSICTPLHCNALHVYRIPYALKHYEAVAVAGCGLCRSTNSNFWFRIYRVRGGGKYEMIFATDEAEGFGFLRSNAQWPTMIVWTRGSATFGGARVFQFDGSEYQESGRWLEEYQYKDEEGEVAFHDTPEITS